MRVVSWKSGMVLKVIMISKVSCVLWWFILHIYAYLHDYTLHWRNVRCHACPQKDGKWKVWQNSAWAKFALCDAYFWMTKQIFETNLWELSLLMLIRTLPIQEGGRGGLLAKWIGGRQMNWSPCDHRLEANYFPFPFSFLFSSTTFLVLMIPWFSSFCQFQYLSIKSDGMTNPSQTH